MFQAEGAAGLKTLVDRLEVSRAGWREGEGERKDHRSRAWEVRRRSGC